MTKIAGKSNHPKFISNRPLGKDQFKGQSHEKIASIISSTIYEERSQNKIIGLDGTWGSGKSNVIEIIKNKLGESHELFNYDAWGHQEDLQRRSFLEELIEFLCEKKLLDSKKWKQNLKELLSKKRETKSKTVPTLSAGIILAVLVTILFPIAEVIGQDLENPWKIVVTCIPLYLAIGAYFFLSYKEDRFLHISDLFYLYKEKELENTTHVTISEKEPSVREFQTWMDSLSNDLKKKKLIVVFDNMDRLPPDKVKELWSSIHTFFSEESFPNIWVIVPFDRIHVQEAFSSNTATSNHFINKTFSIIFRVTPPVLSDWKEFFESKYIEGFGKISDNDYDMVRNVFDVMQIEITPRNIISFLNELVSLRIMTNEDVKTRYLALFILTKNHLLEKPVDQILSLNFIGPAKEIFKGDSNLQDSIAAVVYGVPLSSASQVTLTRDIEISLREVNTSRIKEISSHPHFLDVLEQVILAQEINIENSILTLSDLQITDDKLDRIEFKVNTLWRILLNKRLGIQVSEQKFLDFDRVLISRIKESEIYTLMRFLLHEYSTSEQFDGGNYYNSINDLKSYVNSIDKTIAVDEFINPITVKPAQLISFVKEVPVDKFDDFEEYKISTDESELNELVINSIEETIEESIAECVSITKLKYYYNFDILISKIEEMIEESHVKSENIESLFTLYKGLSKKKPIEKLPDQLIQSLLNGIEENSEGYYDLVAMRIARGQHFPNQPGTKANKVINNVNDDLPQKIAERIEYFANYGDLLLNALKWPSSLLNESLKILTKSKYGTSKLNIESILKNYNEIIDTVGLDHKSFLFRLNGWAEIAEKNINSENILEIISDVEFFAHAVDVENELTKHCLNEMSLNLAKLDVTSWEDILKDEDSFLFNSLYWILVSDSFKSLPDNLISAYKTVLTDYARGELDLNSLMVWDKIYSKVNKSKLKSTFKNIRDLFISEREITPNQFKYLLPFLKEHGALEKRASDVVRKILTKVASEDDCLSGIIADSDYFQPLIRSAADDAFDFKDIIRQKVENGSEQEGLVDFAKKLKIDFVKKD
jgi:hypothetical protein